MNISNNKQKANRNEELVAIRKVYEEHGVENYYLKNGGIYRNPHEKIIQKLVSVALIKGYIGEKILDLCCGSGEVTLALGDRDITGVDPYTDKAYFKRTGKELLPLSFEDICSGQLSESYDTVVCSFALHLCPKSLLPFLLWQIGQISDKLIVITPNKKPDCDNISNWILVEEIIESRVRMRVYLR